MSNQAAKRSGKQTVFFTNPPTIVAQATVVGPMEGKGPLASYYDLCTEDNYFGEKTWEKAERKFLATALQMAVEKANLNPSDIHYLLAGDLLNQIISANFAARGLQIPFFGLYGACSTIYEGLSLGAMLLDGGFADYVLAATSSHYSTAERQFRFPTEQGVQRPLTSQRTVTGAAALVLAATGNGPRITHVTTGKVVDLGIKDSNDMGSAMAPAAVDTLVTHFQDTGRNPDYYDLIITGDLAAIGKELTIILAGKQGFDLTKNYTDCGLLVYDSSQDVHAGGSGCACSGVITAGYLLKEMIKGRYRKILGVGTGALLSPLSTQQGETIPCIAHAVAMEY
jgi:stage V sporulation protein AD